MRYEMMIPHQIRRAIDKNRPVVLPMGVLEYHGERLAVGMDAQIGRMDVTQPNLAYYTTMGYGQ